MTFTPDQRKTLIQVRLEKAFNPLTLSIIDESHLHVGHPGAALGGGHYAVNITALQFTGLSLIKRHQLVYAELKDLIPQEIHALKINARAPDEDKL